MRYCGKRVLGNIAVADRTDIWARHRRALRAVASRQPRVGLVGLSRRRHARRLHEHPRKDALGAALPRPEASTRGRARALAPPRDRRRAVAADRAVGRRVDAERVCLAPAR